MTLSFFNPDCKLEDDGLSDRGQVFCVPILEAISKTGLENGCMQTYTSELVSAF